MLNAAGTLDAAGMLEIATLLERARQRLAAQAAIRVVLWAVAAVHFGVVTPWILFGGEQAQSLSNYGLLMLATTLAALAASSFLFPSALVAAQTLDGRLNLRERLQSATQVADQKSLDRPQALAMRRAVVQDAHTAAVSVSLPSAIPLPGPASAAPALAALFSVLLAAAVVLLPSAQQAVPTAAAMVGDSKAANANTPARADHESALVPDDAPLREAWEAVEFKDGPARPENGAPLSGDAEAELPFGDLELAASLPRLSPSDAASDGLARAQPSEPGALDFAPRRSTLEEAAERLGELERLWGTPASQADEAPPDTGASRAPPDELETANAPGEEVPEHPVSEQENVEVNDLHPDEERMQQQSDRFSSLPDGMDAATSDMPPWPKAGPGQGKEDDSDRDAEGTGRSSGKPGSGFAHNRRGRRSARIDAGNEDELRMRGIRQAGYQASYQAHQGALPTATPAQLEFVAARSQFTRQAEQAMGDEWVPFEARQQVKRYFQAIEQGR